MVYILFPTRTEFEPFLALLDGPSKAVTGLREGFAGALHGRAVTALVSGVGQANTAQSLTAVLEGRAATLVIMAGCAGAYIRGGLSVGDVAVAAEEVYADLGVVTPNGWKSMEETGLPLMERDGKRYFNRFPTAFGRFEATVKGMDISCLKPPSSGAGRRPGVHFGPFLTVSTATGTGSRGEELYGRYGALCENMEGAAAAQVAALYDVPFIEVRGISNMVDDRDKDKWDIPTASYNCARVIEGII